MGDDRAGRRITTRAALVLGGLVVLSAGLLAAVPADPSAASVVPNGGFEDGTRSWSASPGTALDVTGSGSDRALRLTVGDGAAATVETWSEPSSRTLHRGTTVTLTGEIDLEGAGAA